MEHGPVWIALVSEAALLARAAALDALDTHSRAALPLFGLPFAVKDNIDVAGLRTTAACPAFAYSPPQSASVVLRLEQAGALCIGKTNLDQFATGLVGTRSPYGAVPNPFDPSRISGGSSSGSAVAVALGQVAFALGTDTAGSGRVPAGFTNTIGIKPSPGLLSTHGVVPACRSLDCVSIFASELEIGWRALHAAAAYDADDAYSRTVVPRAPFRDPPRLGVFEPLAFAGDAAAAAAFERAILQMRALGAQLVAIPFAPFAEAAALLYDGPRLAERDAAFGAFVAAHPEACDPVVRDIVRGAAAFSATDAFRGEYRLREIGREVAAVWESIDALLVPTAPNFPTLADVAAEPREVNSRLGTYTNFANLLDLAAIAIPAGFRDDGLPTGVTLLAPAGSDHALAQLARTFLNAHRQTLGTSGIAATEIDALSALPDPRPTIRVAVAGAHMRGMPLNHELSSREASFVAATKTAARYRLYALSGSLPKPGLVRAAQGSAIGVEVWDVPSERFGSFVAGIPPPLAIGNVELDDGAWVKGFVCEPIALEDAREITHHGDWRSFLAAERGTTLASLSL
jgi:allophanate hydrolase